MTILMISIVMARSQFAPGHQYRYTGGDAGNHKRHTLFGYFFAWIWGNIRLCISAWRPFVYPPVLYPTANVVVPEFVLNEVTLLSFPIIVFILPAYNYLPWYSLTSRVSHEILCVNEGYFHGEVHPETYLLGLWRHVSKLYLLRCKTNRCVY